MLCRLFEIMFRKINRGKQAEGAGRLLVARFQLQRFTNRLFCQIVVSEVARLARLLQVR